MRECPPEIQEEFTRIGGTNKYGEPLFKIVWTPNELRRTGGNWIDGFVGYKEFQVCGKTPCWSLMMWKPAESFGSDTRWYLTHENEQGFQDLGEYPYSGMYVPIHSLVHWERDQTGSLKPVILELSSFVVDLILPACIFWQGLSEEEKLEAMRLEEELHENEIIDEMWEAKQDCRPAFRSEAVSFGANGTTTTVLAKKVEVMERGMRRAMEIAARMPRGMSQLPI